jgi:hypothetical protein
MVTNEDFIRAWQTAATFADVIANTGISKGQASARAARLRKHGVELKTFPRRSAGERQIDWDALKSLANSLV